jgi:Flp pilus assembly protein TadD
MKSMPTLEASLSDAYDRFRRGDLVGAGIIARRLIEAKINDPRLSALAGMVAIHEGDAARAAYHLRLALAATPDSLPLRTNLAFALVQTGALDEARRVASIGGAVQLRRITAFVDQQQGRTDAAIAGFRRVVAEFTEDYESWSNLGLLFLQSGDITQAEAAFHRSLAIQPLQPGVYRELAGVLAMGECHEERRSLMREAIRLCPGDAALFVQLGLAEGALDDFAAAEAAYREAIRLAPTLPDAYLEFGMMLERLNRLDELDDLIASARGAGVQGPQIDFIAACALRRRGMFAQAWPLAQSSAPGVNAGHHAQLVGEIADALGHTDEAFAAFTAMNAASAKMPASAYARELDFPSQVAATIERLTPAAISRWSIADPATTPPSPIFIVGFPRSGTTLLDTLLMNLPELRVLEEVPAMERIEGLLGDPDRIAGLSTADADRLRSAYFETLRELVPGFDSTRQIVDKLPTNMVRAALIHRLFPNARFVFVERHPCDAVLSCFISRFQVNQAMVQFQDLESTARLYDLAAQAWQRASTLLPLSVHRVRYERMTDDLESEMRPLLAWLDLPWRDGILDNQRSAKGRGHIATPSYSQVTQPIYRTAVNRWVRYREHLAPVLPVLAPWAERLGYTL